MPLGFYPYDDATTLWEAMFAPLFFLLVMEYLLLRERFRGRE